MHLPLATIPALLATLAAAAPLLPREAAVAALPSDPQATAAPVKRWSLDKDHPPYLENKYQRLYKAGDDETAVRETVKVDKRDMKTVYQTLYVTVYPIAAGQSATATMLGIAEDDIPDTTTSAAPASSVVVKEQADQSTISPSQSFAGALATPSVKGTTLLGKCNYDPDMTYLPQEAPPLPQLSQNDLGAGPNQALSTNYPIYNGSGTIDIPFGASLQPLDFTPTLSRDNGKGGFLNGYHIWVFADTATTDPDGNMVGFVSSSVAVDQSMNGLNNQAITLRDNSGEWANSQGQVRGFAPFTEGEMAYTNDNSGAGERYAIWTESAFIPYTSTDALLYAPVVYINSNANPQYTSTGMTLMKLSIDNYVSGPAAERVVEKIFSDDTPEWGGVAAIRSWGPSGPGGSDGRVYAIANTIGGLLISRVNAADATDAQKYEFYDAATKTWGGYATRAKRDVDNTAHVFVNGAYATVDIFYSPHHLTWIMVFETPYADNKFYWRYLTPADGKPVYPGWAAGGASDDSEADDYVNAIITGSWSEPQLLYQAPTPANGFAYGGGVHQGYFGADDITNGGTKMLLSWTSPLGDDAYSVTNGYDQVTAVIEFA